MAKKVNTCRDFHIKKNLPQTNYISIINKQKTAQCLIGTGIVWLGYNQSI